MFIQIRLDELYGPPLFILFHERVMGLINDINLFKVFKVLKEHDAIQLLSPLPLPLSSPNRYHLRVLQNLKLVHW